nr:hypothetical protein [Tanacetum cinerariifolium]
MLIQQDEGSGTPTEPHHTPSQEAQPSSPTLISTSSIPSVILIPTVTQSEPTPLRQYTQRARITQSSALPPVADEPASPMRDVSEGEACPTDSGFIAYQDRATIAKSSTLPHDTAPRVTSPTAVEGSMQQTINELMALCTSLQRQHSDLLVQFQAQTVEINKLNVRVKILEDNQGVIGARSADDAPIKGRRIDEEEDTKEMATVLTSMDAATVLVGGIDVPTGSYSISTAGPPVVDFTLAGKEVMVEFDTPKKQRLQEEIDAQVARELEEQLEREDKRMTEQIARDAYVARIHTEEELQGMIDSLDRTNETIAKNNLGWKVKDFKGMTFEEIKAKFAAVWKLVEDFILIGSKEEAERLKRKGFNLEQEKAKKRKASEETQNYMHAPIEWKLYDLSGVHHVTAKDKEIFMLVEKDYPLRKGLALVMICYKLKVENYSQIAEDLIRKIYNIANSPR